MVIMIIITSCFLLAFRILLDIEHKCCSTDKWLFVFLLG